MKYIVKTNNTATSEPMTLSECLDLQQTLREAEPESVITVELAEIPSKYNFIDIT